MKVLVIGANGFVGRHVAEALEAAGHEVHLAGRGREEGERNHTVDLLDRETIARALQAVKPEAVVNSAGIVANNETAAANPVMTRNLLEEITSSGLAMKRVIISGSAAEYGIVDSVPVAEDAPLHGDSPYAVSKIQETAVAQEYRDRGLSVVVARIFNPIGPGMADRFLIPGIIRQVLAVKAGTQEEIQVSRLDALRDYLDVRDLSQGIAALIEGEPKEFVYNLGSGASTSNGQLVKLVLEHSGLTEEPKIVEIMDQPEPLFASQADITRMQKEFEWIPKIGVDQSVKEIIKATRQ